MNKKAIFSGFCFSLFLITISCNIVVAYQSYPYAESFWATCCFLYLILFVVWIVIGIWAYKDAERRGKSGALWLILIILFGIIAIIIWLAVRPPLQESKLPQIPQRNRFCPNCGREIPFDARICPYCGKDFETKL